MLLQVGLGFFDFLRDCFLTFFSFQLVDDLLSLSLKTHRSGLLDYSVEVDGSGSQTSIGRILLRLTPPLHADPVTTQTITTLKLVHDPLAGAEESAILSSIYLTIPIGPLLDVSGASRFTVGQWACLPLLPHG